MTVLTALAVLTIVATELQYNARVDATLAENARDELIAYYNAKNAMEIELGILRAVRQAQGTIKQLLPMLPLPSLPTMVPVECGLIGQFVTLADDSPLPLRGECMAKASAEKGKIDINRLGSISEKFRVRSLILGRLLDPRFDRFFEEETSLGERVIRDELVSFMSDYVDPDTISEGTAAGDEDDVYARMKDRYKVKNAPFDTISELQLVYGISDDLYAELEKSFTVYPVGGITLATADMSTIAAVVRQAAVNPNDLALYGEPMLLLVTQIDEMRRLPFGGAMLNAQTLTGLARSVGLSLDETRLKDFVDDNTSMDWYTILATGQINAVEKRIQATYNLGSNQLVYYREE